MNQLDVINNCLATMGEAPLNTVDEDHPFVAGALRIMRQENSRIQGMSWWFNTEHAELLQDPTTGFVVVPGDAIRVTPYGGIRYVQRGNRLYDTHRGSYVIGCAVHCTLIRDIPWEDTPPTYQFAVNDSTVRKFQRNYDADRVKMEQILGDARETWAALRTEHIRNVRANFVHKPSSQATLGHMVGAGHGRLFYPGWGTQ